MFAKLIGNSIILIGAANAGKTTLYNFLKDRKITEKYTPSHDVDKVSIKLKDLLIELLPFNVWKTEATTKNLRNISLKVKKLWACPGFIYGEKSTGGLETYKYLKDPFDYVFYLFNAEKVFNDDDKTLQNLAHHTTRIADYLKKGRQPRKGFIFIGTHEDELSIKNDEINDEYRKKFAYLISVIIKKEIKYKILIGSFKKDSITEFVERILEGCSNI